MIIPTKLNINYAYAPIANPIIIGITSVAFIFQITHVLSEDVIEQMVLNDFNPIGLVGTMFLHGNFFHLLGNMYILWIFGNAVNSVVGNKLYPLVYLGVGVCASLSHVIISGGPAIGASGAVSGIIGMSLVLFPVARLNIIGLLWFSLFKASVKSYWIILFYFLLSDIGGVFSGGDAIAHWAHLGGFVAGAMLAVYMLRKDKVTSYHSSLLDLWFNRKKNPNHIYSDEPDPLPPVIEIPDSRVVHDVWGEHKANQPSDPFELNPTDITQPNIPLPTKNNQESIVSKSITPPPLEPITLGFFLPRLLRVIRKKNEFSCYFVNEGDNVKIISVESTQANSVIYYPKEVMKKKEPGWITFKKNDAEIPKDPSFILSYDPGDGTKVSKRYVITEDNNKMVEVL